MNIYLVGYRCCGKSSLGKLLAERLNWSFVDIDARLVAQTGQAIATIVNTRGWHHFRRLEQGCMAAVAAGQHQVVATGGGVVICGENVKAMKASGVVVWLRASATTIRERMLNDPQTADQRPALTQGVAGDEIESVLAERTPLYRAAGDIELDTAHGSIDFLVRDLVTQLKPFMPARQGIPSAEPAP